MLRSVTSPSPSSESTNRRRLHLILAAVVVVAALLAVPAGAVAKPGRASVMTRNVYLGADLTAGVQAGSLQGLVDAAGTILHQVDQNNFQVRAKGLAAEILGKNPDLVGLQEVALWRTGPCTENPIPPKATHVRYDYLKLLLEQLNKGKKRYRVVDRGARVRLRGLREHRRQRVDLGARVPARQRDQRPADDARRDPRPRRPRHDLERPGRPLPHAAAGSARRASPINVTRGWTRVDAKVPGAPKFRFVNTHLESFDNQATNHTNNDGDVGNGQIRRRRPRSCSPPAARRPASCPVILVGDLNSDTKTEVKPGDALAYKALLQCGLRGAKHEQAARLLPQRRRAHDRRRRQAAAISTTRSTT